MRDSTRTEPSKSKKRILVVDDNEMLLKAWDRLLCHEDCDYKLTSSPQQALEWLEAESFDIIISDIVMPGVDGFDLVREAWQKRPMTQMVFTTAYSCDFRHAPLERGHRSQGDVHVLLKPYQDLSKIEEFVSRLIAGDKNLNQVCPLHGEGDINFHLWHL